MSQSNVKIADKKNSNPIKYWEYRKKKRIEFWKEHKQFIKELLIIILICILVTIVILSIFMYVMTTFFFDSEGVSIYNPSIPLVLTFIIISFIIYVWYRIIDYLQFKDKFLEVR